MANLLYGKQLAVALGKDGTTKKDFRRAWKVAIQAVIAMLRFKKGITSWRDRGVTSRDRTLRGFHLLPPTPLRRLQKELPPDTIELILHGLKGELLLGPDVVSLNVTVSQIKQRLEVHARNEVIKGRLSRALQLYSFIALGAVVHLLHKRRAVDDLETLKMLLDESAEGDGAFSPDTMSRLKAVAATLPAGGVTGAAPAESKGELPAARIELTAVVFIHVYGLVAWGDPTAGGSIPLALSERLSAGITFAVGNTRAFAAVGQQGSVTTWGDPACGGHSGHVAEQLQSRAFQICHNEWAFTAFREGGQLVCWGDPDAGGAPGDVASSLTSGVVKVCSTEFAFAALKENGQVLAWGDASVGGDLSSVKAQLHGVVNLWANSGAFVAAKEDGSVVTWGDAGAGGVVDDHVQHSVRNLDTVTCNLRAFAAITRDGRAVAWGAPGCGGDASAVQDQLEDVVEIIGNGRAFVATKVNGGLVCWGNADFGGDATAVRSLNHSVVEVVSSSKAFAALKEDPMSLGYTVHTWGDPQTGGDSSAVSGELIGNVLQVEANDWAFAARRDDGVVVCWGDRASGGDTSSVAERIRAGGGAAKLYHTTRAFAALLRNGSVCAWGELSCGGDSTPAERELEGEKVVDMCANDYAFAARTASGAVVAWGHKLYGGSIDEDTASKLGSGVTKMIGNKLSFLAMKRSGTYVT